MLILKVIVSILSITFVLAANVENSGSSCVVSLPSSITANSKLPDPFKTINGTQIANKADWTCRRQEISKLAQKYVYGEKPDKPETVTGTVSSSSITVSVTHSGKTASFSAGVQLPSGTGPFPAVIVYGGIGGDTATIKAAGVAIISYDPYKLGQEGPTSRTAMKGAFYDLYGASSTTGLLMAWAWGVSRIIDVIEEKGGTIIKANAIGVTGCSRFGKGTFVAGVFDERIALVMPIESGTGGVPIFRGVSQDSTAEQLKNVYSGENWLGGMLGSYLSNAPGLPVDTHEMVAMVAPRGLFIMDNPSIDYLASKSASVAALGGEEVYKALGVPNNIVYWSDVQDGNHCAVRSEWKQPLQQFIQKFLLGSTTATTSSFHISSKRLGDLSQWRDWQTPSLS